MRGFSSKETYRVETRAVNPYNNSFEALTRDLKRCKRNGYRVVLLSGSRTRAKRLAEDLRDYDLSSFYSEDMEREVSPGEIMVSYGHVSEGYEYPMLKFMVISETDIFGKKKKSENVRFMRTEDSEFFGLKVEIMSFMKNHGLESMRVLKNRSR